MSGLLDDSEIGLPCPKCGRETKKRIGWIKSNREFTCACGTRVVIDASQFKREFGKIDRALDDLQRSLKNFGK